MEKREYVCPKCGNKQYEENEIRLSGGTFAKNSDVQNKKVAVIPACTVAYSDLYKHSTGVFGNIVDFFTN